MNSNDPSWPISVKLPSPPTRPTAAIAPSWSWASISGLVDMLPQWQATESPEPFRGIKRKQLDEGGLCEVLGVRCGDSVAERSGLTSTAKLNVSCYLVSFTFADPEDSAELIRRFEKAHTDELGCHTGGVKVRFTIKTEGGSFADEGGTTRDDSETKGDEGWSIRLLWDIWDEFTCDERLFLMPGYKVTQYMPDDFFDQDLYTSVDGLILRRGVDSVTNETVFRRLGTFYIDFDHSQREFWSAALRFPPMDGVECVKKHQVLGPDLSVSKNMDPVFKRREFVLQYQITLA